MHCWNKNYEPKVGRKVLVVFMSLNIRFKIMKKIGNILNVRMQITRAIKEPFKRQSAYEAKHLLVKTKDKSGRILI